MMATSSEISVEAVTSFASASFEIENYLQREFLKRALNFTFNRVCVCFYTKISLLT